MKPEDARKKLIKGEGEPDLNRWVHVHVADSKKPSIWAAWLRKRQAHDKAIQAYELAYEKAKRQNQHEGAAIRAHSERMRDIAVDLANATIDARDEANSMAQNLQTAIDQLCKRFNFEMVDAESVTGDIECRKKSDVWGALEQMRKAYTRATQAYETAFAKADLKNNQEASAIRMHFERVRDVALDFVYALIAAKDEANSVAQNTRIAINQLCKRYSLKMIGVEVDEVSAANASRN